MTEPNPLATPEPVWLTEATPLAEIDVELAHRLVLRLLSTMRSQLTEAERRDLDGLDPPTIVTGVAEEMEGRFLDLLGAAPPDFVTSFQAAVSSLAWSM